jgi:hypothetical protein
METCRLSLKANTHGTIGLRLTIKFDNLIIFDSRLTEIPIEIEYDFSDNQPHVLELIMSGKEPQDTVLDATKNIIQDRVINISNVMIDDIDITALVYQKSCYMHDFNGSGFQTIENFYGTMGCNGTVRFVLASPVYIWLLENM